MKRIWIRVTVLLLAMQTIVQAQNWDKIIDRVSEQVVLIEYFEQIISAEAIVEKERIKRQLTGILVDDSGLIMTSAEIFPTSLEFSSMVNIFDQTAIPTDIRVKFGDEEYQPAQFIGKDDDNKIAFIQLLKEPKIKPIRFHSKRQLSVGSKILIVQHLNRQYDYALLVSERVINSIVARPRQRYLCENSLRSLSEFGLVLNAKGQPIGFLRGIPQTTGGFFEMPEFSIQPAEIILFDQFADFIKNPPLYRQKETTRKKWLGIYMQPFNRAMAKFQNQPGLTGVLINTVLDNSPAKQAGLKPGDVITTVNNQRIAAEKDNELETFRKIIREQPESQVTFKLFRNGEYLDKTISLGETPISQFLADEVSNAVLGFSAKELTQDIILARQLEWDADGVWVSKVERAGLADVAGLRPGDLILKINEQKISNLDDIQEAFEYIEYNKPAYLSFFIQRRTDTRFLFIQTKFQDPPEKQGN